MRVSPSRLASAAAAGAMIFAASPGMAHAGPDPHIPDPAHDYCPGSGIGAKLFWGYCDGEPYEDGSYWHVWGVTITHVSAAVWSARRVCRELGAGVSKQEEARATQANTGMSERAAVAVIDAGTRVHCPEFYGPW